MIEIVFMLFEHEQTALTISVSNIWRILHFKRFCLMTLAFDFSKWKTGKQIEIFVAVAVKRRLSSIPHLSLEPVGHTTIQ